MIYTTVLAFCPARLLNRSLSHYEEVKTKGLTQLVIADNHYPVDREKNRKELVRLALGHGALFFDSGGDLGAAQSFNQLTSYLPLYDEDYILGYDPDSWALTLGFDQAMADVLNKYPDLAYVSLTNEDVTFKNPEIIWEDRKDVRIPVNRPEMCNVTMFRWSWLKSIGGLQQVCPYYGYIESYLWEKLAETKMKYGYLPDYLEDSRITSIHDPEYVAWKKAQISFQFNGSFKEFLEQGKKP